MSRLFSRHAGRHTRVLGSTGWGGLARYCADASRHPVVEKPFHRRAGRNPYAPLTTTESTR